MHPRYVQIDPSLSSFSFSARWSLARDSRSHRQNWRDNANDESDFRRYHYSVHKIALPAHSKVRRHRPCGGKEQTPKTKRRSTPRGSVPLPRVGYRGPSGVGVHRSGWPTVSVVPCVLWLKYQRDRIAGPIWACDDDSCCYEYSGCRSCEHVLGER